MARESCVYGYTFISRKNLWRRWLKGWYVHPLASIGFSVLFYCNFCLKLEISNETSASYIFISIISIVFWNSWFLFYFIFFLYCHLFFLWISFSMIFIGFIINLFGRFNKFVSWISKRKKFYLFWTTISTERMNTNFAFSLFELYWIFTLDFHLFLWSYMK